MVGIKHDTAVGCHLVSLELSKKVSDVYEYVH